MSHFCLEMEKRLYPESCSLVKGNVTLCRSPLSFSESERQCYRNGEKGGGIGLPEFCSRPQWKSMARCTNELGKRAATLLRQLHIFINYTLFSR